MVTKLPVHNGAGLKSSVLAKILMVTKRKDEKVYLRFCSVLAKILMVTKPKCSSTYSFTSSVLAKILMVTKLLS